jgi:hypothetical protein
LGAGSVEGGGAKVGAAEVDADGVFGHELDSVAVWD